MPIYEFKCADCDNEFEVLTLKVNTTLYAMCPKCDGVGQKLVSAPAIVCEIFDETATHRLPGWQEKMKRAETRDNITRRNIRTPPLPHDRGQGIKTYHAEFGYQERQQLERKAQLDNM